jgi:hypothetical protein
MEEERKTKQGENCIKRYVAKPTAEGVLALYKAITGKEPIPATIAKTQLSSFLEKRDGAFMRWCSHLAPA